jgi:5'-deoxynucleotidase YfbR-like HD superfamily hydrolase
MAKSAFLHLALVAHELQEKRRKVRLDDEFLIKLSIIHDLTEELSKELGHK